ncbi:MAG: 4-hydroxy-tetrahydrodipicolinate reductase, partial [Firmicutes bacterium]|nr:4-hydroxy-tetrahydrodipicolinate reductase [Bacillota bacterium]
YYMDMGRMDRRAARDPHAIGMSAVRGGTIVGEHTILFAGQDEMVELKHTALSRDVFAAGAISAARFLIGRSAGLYDMNQLVETML